MYPLRLVFVPLKFRFEVSVLLSRSGLVFQLNGVQRIRLWSKCGINEKLGCRGWTK